MRKLANGGSTSVDRYGGIGRRIWFKPRLLYVVRVRLSLPALFYLKGDICMKGMHGIYRINPAIFGGVLGGCTGILLCALLF